MTKSKKGGNKKLGKRTTSTSNNRCVDLKSKEDKSMATECQKYRKELYEQIVSMKSDKKMSERVIAKEIGIPKSTVHDYLIEWYRKTPVSNLKKGGRPKKLDSGDKRSIRAFLRINTNAKVKDIQNDLLTSRGKHVSATTIRRLLKNFGFKFSKPQIVPLLTAAQKMKRIEWCKRHAKMALEGVFFSDETYIEIGGVKSGVWHKIGNRPKVGKAKFVGKLMFWGAISCRAKSPLFAIDGTMNTIGTSHF
jgi:transposase